MYDLCECKNNISNTCIYFGQGVRQTFSLIRTIKIGPSDLQITNTKRNTNVKVSVTPTLK